MKPTFHASTVNGPFEDPCIYIRILREGRALLFDLGFIGRLGQGNLLKITDVFVTHTHIDHFMGFDMLLRSILRRDVPLRVFGPASVIKGVEGKLGGYTWNLIQDYPIKIEVFGLHDGVVSHSSFYAENSFRRLDHPESEFDGTLLREASFKIKGLLLSHDIPVMAYSLEEEYHININKALLQEMNLPVGPWLSELKKTIREIYEVEGQGLRAGSHESEGELRVRPKPLHSAANSSPPLFEVATRTYTLTELMKIVTITRGQKISYVIDIAPTDQNIEKIIPFVRGSDTLFCEAYFLEKDRDRARERNHLTAVLAGRIAREAGVGNLSIMHFSPKYRDAADELYQEAMKEFKGKDFVPGLSE